MEKRNQIVEALIFASDSPLPARKIKELIDEDTIGVKEIKEAIEQIKQFYEENDSPLEIQEVAGGYQIVTRKYYAPYITRLYKSRSTQRLTQKGLETLAIIAYKQPITKQEIEAIRGVNSDAVIRTLIERHLITVSGREKAPGNPLLYGTTKYFLEYFGLNDLSDLPKLKEMDELLKGDEQFLESLDQVSLESLDAEALGLKYPGEQPEDNENEGHGNDAPEDANSDSAHQTKENPQNDNRDKNE